MRNQIGSNNPNWKGGRLQKTNGYIIIQQPTHPFCDIDGYVLEHRLIMERHLGRTLLPTEVVHHINGIPDDNRIENLMLFSNQKEHAKIHYKSDEKGHYQHKIGGNDG
jgi:uncharacterized protein (DUF1330 family)